MRPKEGDDWVCCREGIPRSERMPISYVPPHDKKKTPGLERSLVCGVEFVNSMMLSRGNPRFCAIFCFRRFVYSGSLDVGMVYVGRPLYRASNWQGEVLAFLRDLRIIDRSMSRV